ncbi:B3 domain-containing transcription repressor VAL2-like [Phoenix dactylifera]|uniref:B3 domain-containing transcription repressor VAL2-like n=1 Tax=Phoenix dactylifera TaxID=42345 RepID=A0A8B7MV60_PHODC|nr:B3 domain-containing transcription repressor VAL2-like [Phoenix dactylifera]
MGSKRCMNTGCGATEPGGEGEWRKGWGLKSGGFATLCDKCGMAYEQLVFCDKFHLNETGWRDCIFCGKQLHCGCIASKSSFDLLDSGGVQCISCMKNSKCESIAMLHHSPPSLPSGCWILFMLALRIPGGSFQGIDKINRIIFVTVRMAHIPCEVIQELLPQPPPIVLAPSSMSPMDEKKGNDFVARLTINAGELQHTSTNGERDNYTRDKGNDIQLGSRTEGDGHSILVLAQRESINGSFGHIKREQVAFHLGEKGSSCFTNKNDGPIGSSLVINKGDRNDTVSDKIIYESLAHACLSISLGTSNSGNMTACLNSKNPQITFPLSNTLTGGRQQDKVLSAFQQVQRSHHFLPMPLRTSSGTDSEASKEIFSGMSVARPPGEGRVRNQLLPRYWPRITDQELRQISGDSNSTIVPLFEKILSASDAGRIGRLVLPKACAEAYFPPISQPEGLPLKIQDVKGKEWVLQFRFWPNNNSRMYVLEGVTPCIQSMQLQAGDTVIFSRIDPEGKLVMGFRKATNSVSLQDSQISAFASGAIGNEAFFSGVIENLPIPLLALEKKRSRNIGSKSKRLLMENEDAFELKLTWEEAQDLLRPPPSVKPSIVMIEDHEFEEYEDPPVFGKRTIFTVRASGGHDQWVQCDNCFKWRRLPVDVLLPSKWTCTDNKWDPKRSSCSVPNEISPTEMQNLLQQNAEMRRQRIAASSKQSPPDLEASTSEPLGIGAAPSDNRNQATTRAATTTKHPRHRPGCTCIVCIQPPSGKGPKHKPTCMCNVCMTVKRRFATLMMRKKKRQSEQEEAESHKRLLWSSNEETEAHGSFKCVPFQENATERLEMSKGYLDLNCHPEHEGFTQSGPARVSMMSLLQEAGRPLDAYLKQNGLASLACEQQPSSNIQTLPQVSGEREGRTPDESHLSSPCQERGSVNADEGDHKPDQVQNDTA